MAIETIETRHAAPGTSGMPLARRSALRGRSPVLRWVLTGAVLAWFAVLILVPTLALVRAALAGGIGTFVAAITATDAQRAFGLTLAITLGATAVNTLFGLAFAIILVRHKFWGKALAAYKTVVEQSTEENT